MNTYLDLFYNTKRRVLAKFPGFASEIATTPIVWTCNVTTGTTDGKSVFLNPEYFESADDNERIFVFSHEVLHKIWKHVLRYFILKEKGLSNEDMELWNDVTDARINASLKESGLKIPKYAICSDDDKEYGDWVLEYNSEELFKMKKKEREKKQKEGNGQNKNSKEGTNHNSEKNLNQGKKQSSENNSNQGLDNSQHNRSNDKQEKREEGEYGNKTQQDESNEKKKQIQHDCHSLWEEAFKKYEEEKSEKENGKKEKLDKQENTPDGQEETDFYNIDERKAFEENQRVKREQFEKNRNATNKKIRETGHKPTQIGDVGSSKENIDWKLLLRRELEKTETVWSQRRSIAENNFAYRRIERDIEDEAKTEVMIDVSGSVSLSLIKAFLRQIKPILEHSKLKVGCFDEKFFGFVDIKNMKDIDSFKLPKGYGGCTNLDLPVRSFTKSKDDPDADKINKIIFTDGEATYDQWMPKEDLKKENVIWLVYRKKDFNPCCGKVIYITERQLEKLNVGDKEI